MITNSFTCVNRKVTLCLQLFGTVIVDRILVWSVEEIWERWLFSTLHGLCIFIRNDESLRTEWNGISLRFSSKIIGISRLLIFIWREITANCEKNHCTALSTHAKGNQMKMIKQKDFLVSFAMSEKLYQLRIVSALVLM